MKLVLSLVVSFVPQNGSGSLISTTKLIRLHDKMNVRVFILFVRSFCESFRLFVWPSTSRFSQRRQPHSRWTTQSMPQPQPQPRRPHAATCASAVAPSRARPARCWFCFVITEPGRAPRDPGCPRTAPTAYGGYLNPRREPPGPRGSFASLRVGVVGGVAGGIFPLRPQLESYACL